MKRNMCNLAIASFVCLGLGQCAGRQIDVAHDPKEGLITIKPKNGNILIQYPEDNPNLVFIRSLSPGSYEAGINADDAGLRSLQVVKLTKTHDLKEPILDGTFIMTGKEVRRIKDIRTVLLLRQPQE